MARVIVTGAGGQMGSELVPRLYERGHDCTLTDLEPPEEASGHAALDDHFSRLERAGGETLDWRSDWRILDVTDADRVARLVGEVRPEIVVHLAAILSGKGELEPELCWRVNVDGLRHLLEALARRAASTGAVPRLVWPSSIAAFGWAPGERSAYEVEKEAPDSPLLPLTMYGVTKVAGERLGWYYATRGREFGDARGRVDFRALRFPGLISVVPPGGGSSDYANEMYFRAAAGEEAVCFVEPDVRLPFMHMDDAIRALLELTETAAPLTRRIYNLAAFPAPSAAEIAAAIREHVPEFEVRYEPDRGNREYNVRSWPADVDDSAAREEWGWRPEIDSLDAMTERLLADLRDAHAGEMAPEPPC